MGLKYNEEYLQMQVKFKGNKIIGYICSGFNYEGVFLFAENNDFK